MSTLKPKKGHKYMALVPREYCPRMIGVLVTDIVDGVYFLLLDNDKTMKAKLEDFSPPPDNRIARPRIAIMEEMPTDHHVVHGTKKSADIGFGDMGDFDVPYSTTTLKLSPLEAKKKELDRALKQEDYERAAVLRDDIKKLEP